MLDPVEQAEEGAGGGDDGVCVGFVEWLHAVDGEPEDFLVFPVGGPDVLRCFFEGAEVAVQDDVVAVRDGVAGVGDDLALIHGNSDFFVDFVGEAGEDFAGGELFDRGRWDGQAAAGAEFPHVSVDAGLAGTLAEEGKAAVERIGGGEDRGGAEELGAGGNFGLNGERGVVAAAGEDGVEGGVEVEDGEDGAVEEAGVGGAKGGPAGGDAGVGRGDV